MTFAELLAEAFGEVVGSGFGDDFGFLEGGLLAFFDEDALVIGCRHGQLDSFVLPSGKQDGVCKFDAADALGGG